MQSGPWNRNTDWIHLKYGNQPVDQEVRELTSDGRSAVIDKFNREWQILLSEKASYPNIAEFTAWINFHKGGLGKVRYHQWYILYCVWSDTELMLITELTHELFLIFLL